MKNIKFKLTDRNRATHNGFVLPADGGWFYPADRTSPPKPCTDTVLHHYDHPLLAVLFNPTHGNYPNPRLFEIETDEQVGTDGLKGWCRAQRVLRELPLPEVTTDQRVEFAIRVAKRVCADPVWNVWADAWLDGSDRTAARAAARAANADAAARAAANAAALAAAHAADADAAAYAVCAAACADAAAYTAAYAAAYTAHAYAAYAAAHAACAAAEPIDFLEIAMEIVNRG
jgi:hypothetical protein